MALASCDSANDEPHDEQFRSDMHCFLRGLFLIRMRGEMTAPVLVPALIASSFRNRSAVRVTGASGTGTFGHSRRLLFARWRLSLLAGNDADMTVFSRGMTEEPGWTPVLVAGGCHHSAWLARSG
jgi:hypothetical protein